MGQWPAVTFYCCWHDWCSNPPADVRDVAGLQGSEHCCCFIMPCHFPNNSILFNVFRRQKLKRPYCRSLQTDLASWTQRLHSDVGLFYRNTTLKAFHCVSLSLSQSIIHLHTDGPLIYVIPSTLLSLGYRNLGQNHAAALIWNRQILNSQGGAE